MAAIHTPTSPFAKGERKRAARGDRKAGRLAS